MVWSFLALALLAAPQADEPGFGGAADAADVADVADAADDAAGIADAPLGDAGAPATGTASTDLSTSTPLPSRSEFVGAAGGRTLAVFPEDVPPPPPNKTPFEIELEKARLDPTQHPLLQLRVDVARAQAELTSIQRNGLFGAREQEATVAELRALLADVERIAMHRMNVCMTRQGKPSVVKNFRMTPAGPVHLSTAELLAQTSAVDPDGCGRIHLIDKALVTRVKRAHEVKNILETTKFSFHEMATRRGLEAELKVIEKELAKEDLPIITLPGAADPYGGRR